MNVNAQNRSKQTRKARRKAMRMAGALPPDRQSLAAVYALGIRDGLQIAADILHRTGQPKGET
jgi:hypothetical protein